MILPIVLLGLGLGLIVAEIFLPSFGILSVLAGSSIVAALVFAFRHDTQSGFWFFLSTAALVPLTISLAFGLLPKTSFGRRLILSGGDGEPGPASVSKENLLGAEGTVESPLRPSGFARLQGRRMDVSTRGDWLDVGARVRVVEVRDNKLIVSEAPTAPPAPTTESAS